MANPYLIQFKYRAPSANKPVYYSHLSRLKDTLQFEVHGQNQPLAEPIPEKVKSYLSIHQMQLITAMDETSVESQMFRDKLPSCDLTREQLEKILTKTIDKMIEQDLLPHTDITGIKTITTHYRKIYNKHGQRIRPTDFAQSIWDKDFHINDIVTQLTFLKRFIDLFTIINQPGVYSKTLIPEIASLQQDIQKFIKQKKSDYSWVKYLLIAIPTTAIFLTCLIAAMANPLLLMTNLGIALWMTGMFGGMFATTFSWMAFANKWGYRATMTERAGSISQFFKTHESAVYQPPAQQTAQPEAQKAGVTPAPAPRAHAVPVPH